MTTATETKKQPLLSKVMWLFLIAMVLANTAGNMYGNILPLYLKSLGASVGQIGLFFTLFQILPLVLQILGGWISDSLGRLRSIAMGSVAGVLSYVGLLLAPTWQWVFLGESLGAVTRSLIGPSFGAFIAEESAEENRARVYGITQTIFAVVTVVGPPLGGWLADLYGFKTMLFFAALIYLSATIIRVFMAKRAASHEKKKSPGKLTMVSLKDNLGAMFSILISGGLITWMLITDGVRDVAFSISGTYIPLFTEEIGGLSTTQIGWLTSIFGIAIMAINIPAGWLADKKGERVNIVLGFLFNFVALMAFIRLETFWGYALSWTLFGIGVGLMQPAYQSLLSKALPDKLRGTGFGLIQSSLGIFSLPSPYIGGYLYENVSPRAPFQVTAWVSLLAIIPAWLKFKLPAKTGEDSAQEDGSETPSETPVE
ncbi:MAG: MFS transporter [Anaerolineaceae bacterium]|nr:MFS transporter [Anaerolineaceae bacterium]